MPVKMITLGKLKKGDVILSTTADTVSKIVKISTNSKFSHARLYIGGEYIIEAIDPVVREEKLVKVLKGDLYAAVYRVGNLTDLQKANIISYATKQRGKEYDLSGAIGSSGAGIAIAGLFPTITNLIDSESDFYCSELVAFAYKNAGIKLEVLSSQTTPKDLAHNKKLEYVGHLKVKDMH
jgi:cell wall-associated NlpC family hydrolase